MKVGGVLIIYLCFGVVLLVCKFFLFDFYVYRNWKNGFLRSKLLVSFRSSCGYCFVVDFEDFGY